MAGWKDLSEVWNTIQEFDLRSIRDLALSSVRIAIVGAADTGQQELAEALRHDPLSPVEATQTPINVLALEELAGLPKADLVLIIALPETTSLATARSLAERCANANLHTLLICRLPNADDAEKVLDLAQNSHGILAGAFEDHTFLLKHFVPAVLSLLPDTQHLALGRQFPLFRTAIARNLIEDTCLANAAYSLSTGLAEAIPVLTLPLSVADMVVLTKSQAFLAYKLGLALGFSTQWQDYTKEFGSVVGSGFIMRQLARQLVGLVPGWGVVPKIVIAYSGTYVVGHTILQWYLAGRVIRKEQLQKLYRQAILEGKIIAYRIIEKAPRIKLPRKAPKKLPAKSGDLQESSKPLTRKLGWFRKPAHPICPACAKVNSPQAAFCQYCGQALTSSQSTPEKPEGDNIDRQDGQSSG